ncbi:MAG: FAD-dependent oxidoreductase [Candidatus Binatia bacterium]
MTLQRPKPGCDYDVAVIGGGPAGIAAAIAAANCGAHVLLVEGNERLGGNVTQAFVHTICGLFLPSAHNATIYAHEGIPRVFAETLEDRGLAGRVEWAGAAGLLRGPDARRLCRSGRRVLRPPAAHRTRDEHAPHSS